MSHNVLLTGKATTDRTVVREIYVDVSNALTIIDQDHTKVHQGKYFSTGYYQELIAGGELTVLFKVDGNLCHTRFKVICGGEGEFSFFTSPTISANGTPLQIVNNNLASSNTTTVQAYHTPTVTSTGTQKWFEYYPAGKSNSPGTVGEAGGAEAILAKDTDYLIKIRNSGQQTHRYQLILAFYETKSV